MKSQSFQRFFNFSRKDGPRDSRIGQSHDGSVVLRERSKSFGFLGPLLIVARQGISWSPLRILGQLWRLITNVGIQREILSLLKLRPFDEIVQNYPGLAFKYVVPNYLARGFTLTERVSCFLHHYTRMHAALPEDVLRNILLGDVTFHKTSDGDNCFALTMGLARPHVDKEGEMSLNLEVNGKKVFSLCFTIVPGSVVQSAATEVLLITRLQGTPRCNSQLKLARKALHDYSPRGLLLAALQGVADAFEIGEIEAVCATRQAAYAKETSDLLKSGYDDFFARQGMVKTPAGFYSSSIPVEGKPLTSFKARDRSKARKRRAMRKQIQSACATFLSGAADRAADSSPGAECLAPVSRVVESESSLVSGPTPDYNLTL